MTKNVIFVWTQNPSNIRESERKKDTPISKRKYWGIGDVIYGILCVNYFCEKLNYNFFIDLSQHPISKYLATNEHPFNSDVDKKIDLVWYLEDHLKKSESNNLFLFGIGCDSISNREEFLKNKVSDKILKYLCKIFTPNDKLNLEINNLKKEINITSNYNIFHFRFGDNEIVNNNKDNEKQYKSAIDLYVKNKKNNEIVLSDTKHFKNILKKNYGAKIIDLKKIGHFGFHDDSDSIKNSLIEFLLCVNAKNIQTATKLGHVSGFTKFSSLLKNNNLINYFLKK